jgi:L-alanine-DL-glutamate epimerase-like enolase superfamily enzyme
MKISRINSQLLRLPADEPLADGPPVPGATRDFVALTIGTDDGLEGIGVTFFGGALTGALKTAVDALGALIVGEDPLRNEAIVDRLRAAAGMSGPGGIFTLALAAIDIALWDIKGKAYNQPVARLVGGLRDRVPTYASGALMRHLTLEQAAQAGPRLVKRGFRQMKMQLALPGDTSPEREVERAQIVRESIGPDINQRWSVHQAIEIGRRLEDVRLFWLEDVTTHDDYAGLARVTQALSTPVAGGEYVYGVTPFRQMLEARSVGIVMIDVLRVGGITQWLKVAGMAEAFNLPVVSHLLPEIHVHLVAGIRNGLTVEYMPWALRLFEEGPVLDKGELLVPDRPGLGLRFDKSALARFAVSG